MDAKTLHMPKYETPRSIAYPKDLHIADCQNKLKTTRVDSRAILVLEPTKP